MLTRGKRKVPGKRLKSDKIIVLHPRRNHTNTLCIPAGKKDTFQWKYIGVRKVSQ